MYLAHRQGLVKLRTTSRRQFGSSDGGWPIAIISSAISPDEYPGAAEAEKANMTHFIDPTREAFAYFKSLPRDTPIHMLNLVRYRELAEYPEGHPLADSGWSGRRAYEEYGRISQPILRRVGGSIVWRGVFEATVIGSRDEVWDDAFIAHYPDTQSFLGLTTDPDFKSAFVHRSAGVLDYRLTRFTPGPAGEGFSG